MFGLKILLNIVKNMILWLTFSQRVLTLDSANCLHSINCSIQPSSSFRPALSEGSKVMINISFFPAEKTSSTIFSLFYQDFSGSPRQLLTAGNQNEKVGPCTEKMNRNLTRAKIF